MGASVFFESASELATISNTFSVSGTATDPTTISLAVTTPTGTTTTYTYAASQITRSSAGVYTKDVTCSEDGTWQAVWTGTGAASDVVSVTWEVFEADLGKLYAPVLAVKSRLGIAASDTTDDFELHQACFAASRSLEQFCERTFYRSASGTARTFEACDWYRLRLPEFCDLVSVSALATDEAGDGSYETAWSASDYQLWPSNPAAAPESRPYTQVRAVGSRTFPLPYGTARRDRVQITGVWGWPAVPMGIKQAALILAAETLKLKDAPFGVLGYGEYGPMRVRANPKVAEFANPYRRNALLVG